MIDPLLPQLLGEQVAEAIEKASAQDEDLRKHLENGDVSATAFSLWLDTIAEKKRPRKIDVVAPILGKIKCKKNEWVVGEASFGRSLQGHLELWKSQGYKGEMMPTEDQETLKKVIDFIFDKAKANKLSATVEGNTFTATRNGKLVAKIDFSIKGDQILQKSCQVWDIKDGEKIQDLFKSTFEKEYSIVSPKNDPLSCLIHGIRKQNVSIPVKINKNIVEINAQDLRKTVCSYCGEKPFLEGKLVGCSCHSTLVKNAKMIDSQYGKRQIVFDPKWNETLSESLKDWGFVCN